MSFMKDLGDLPPPSALSLQTIRAKVEKRTSIDTAPCTGSAVTAACKPAANCCSSSSISPKSSPVGENRRDGRRDSRDSTVPYNCSVLSSVYRKKVVRVCSSYAALFHHPLQHMQVGNLCHSLDRQSVTPAQILSGPDPAKHAVTWKKGECAVCAIYNGSTCN